MVFFFLVILGLDNTKKYHTMFLIEIINMESGMPARIVRLTVGQKFDGQTIINTWSLLSDVVLSSNADLVAVLEGFGYTSSTGASIAPFTPSSVGAIIADLQHGDLSYEFVRVRTPYDPTLILEGGFAAGATGTTSTPNAESPFMALSLKSGKVRGDIRPSFKRISGLPTDMFGDKGVLTGTYVAELTALTQLLANGFTGTSSSTTANFKFITEKLKKSTVDGRTRYVDWDNETEALANYAQPTTWSYAGVATTQVSRKRGRGI